MKKIGILTYHRAENFGATLQVYALQKFLKKETNYDVEIIDYRCKSIEKWYSLYDLSFLFERKNIYISFKVLLEKVFTFSKRRIKKQRFHMFWKKYLKISTKSYTKRDLLPSNYDLYIAGSDQIWNPFITNGFDEAYFLSFETKSGARKVSYAASSEKHCFESFKNNATKIKAYLKGLDGISVRENSLIEELQSYSDKEIAHTVDPTLLLDKSDYVDLVKDPQRRNYVLIYHLQESEIMTQAAMMIAKEKNLDIIEVHAGYIPFLDNERHIQDAGPSELLGYIYHADYIITTSFHGTVLSVIFEKEFYTLNKFNNLRQKELISMLGVNERLFSSVDDIDLSNIIDYNKVAVSVGPFVNKSKEFLLSYAN